MPPMEAISIARGVLSRALRGPGFDKRIFLFISAIVIHSY